MTHPAHHHVVPGLATRGRIALTRDQLVAWGTDFGASARPPLVVAISGELGAGKTTLVQAICAGAGVQEPVTSPTFALVHRYQGASAIVYHLDLYRLGAPAELTNIGWDEIVNAHALVLVEWPERAGTRLPADTVPIDLEYDERDADRRLLLAG
ncbi:MAG TPA: tRNA (adenosine(37)-N6)-threonylcarbamoyltransferase complex ATPase subunit type 1 TsaE [Gemmatimonadaceae bacterium]|nr:tRNA (adenosine(37)-N6)-threonylcarbamoyltransferase complex ATPase subunit type 1 TsaE [Gemmatimonadaceae bacterium]